MSANPGDGLDGWRALYRHYYGDEGAPGGPAGEDPPLVPHQFAVPGGDCLVCRVPSFLDATSGCPGPPQ